MNPFATKLQRCALAAALGTALLGSATPGLANDQLAEFSLDGNEASWTPSNAVPFDHMVLSLVTSPENQRVCCVDPVGPKGVTVDLDEWGPGSYKYELTAVPPVQAKKGAAVTGDGPIDENGRPVSAVQSRARVSKAESRGAVQSGYFTYGVDPNAEE